MVASDTAHRHVETWMRRHIGDAHAFVTDVTSGYAQLNVQGPRSRELLQSLTTADLSNEAFPFRTAREIDIGFARVLCVRITYLGELGYELYIPTEQAAARLRPARRGRRGASACATPGSRRWRSLRMEKGYRDYGHDIDNTDSVLEAGLGFAVDLDKPGGFIGRDAVLAQKAAGPLTRRLVQVLVDDPEPLLFHAEVVLPRRRAGRLRARRVVRPHARRRGRPGDGRGAASRSTTACLDAGAWEVDDRRRALPGRGLAAAALRPDERADQGLSSATASLQQARGVLPIADLVLRSCSPSPLDRPRAFPRFPRLLRGIRMPPSTRTVSAFM